MSAVPLHLHRFENGEFDIFNEEDGLVVDCAGMSEAYAKRMVACWNALTHLTTEEIEEMAEESDSSHALDHIFGDVMSQLDELRIR